MASCELLIELAEPARVYRGGEHVKGHVVVRVDKDVKCNGLKIATTWETHGRGNVTRGTCEETIVFQGEWKTGETHQYEFSLPCAGWPPTYHGTNLNIDHYVFVQADIPWAFDPKEKEPFRVLPSVQREELLSRETQPTELTGIAAGLVGGIFLAVAAVFFVAFLINPFFWAFALVIGGIGTTWWFFAKFLPKWKLGEVTHRLTTPELAPGQVLRGELVIHPRGDVAINGISWDVKAEEVCVKGSGTNKTTYREQIAGYEHQAVGKTTLTAHQRHTFQLEYRLPTDAHYSIDLDDNDLTWSLEARVDIPRWPDWRITETFVVRPLENIGPEDDSAQIAKEEGPGEASVSFAETVDLISKVRQDFVQLDRVIEGVAGLEFEVHAHLERPIGVVTVDSRIGYPDGVVIEANDPQTGVPLLLYVSSGKSQELDDYYRKNWTGRGTIVGYDHRIGSLQIRILD